VKGVTRVPLLYVVLVSGESASTILQYILKQNTGHTHNTHTGSSTGGIPEGAEHFRAFFTRMAAARAALRAVATECQTLAAGFSDEEAAEGLAITEELRAVFQRPASASEEEAPPPEFLMDVPPELLSIILSHLDTRTLACFAATCRSLWCDASPALPTPGLVEMELRRRAEARGLHVGSSLPEGALSWVPYLLKCEFMTR